jgi:hypothetical protein
MNKICALFTLCGLIVFFCLSSCTPVAETVKESPAVETAVEKPLFLGDKHVAANLKCGSCHQENPPEKTVATEVCLSCHAEYADSSKTETTDLMDPHNSHMTYSDCGACHNAHKASREQCSNCHGDMGFNIP